MDSSLWERFARLGPVRELDRVTSGSPAAIVFKIPPTSVPRTIDAILTLARRGISMLKAKRAVEASMMGETVCVSLPCVEDVATVLRELRDAGFEAAEACAGALDVRPLRATLGLTREALRCSRGWRSRLCATGRLASVRLIEPHAAICRPSPTGRNR